MKDSPYNQKNKRIFKEVSGIDLRWSVFGALVLLTFTLGYIGFSKFFISIGETRSILDILYKTLQLFTLESGSVNGSISWELELARWISPVLAAYTVVNAIGFFFRDKLQVLRLKFIKDHVIIIGATQKNYLLARKFSESGYKVVLVEHNDSEYLNVTKNIPSIIELSGDARDTKLLHKTRINKAKYLILFSEDDGINIEIAVNARNLFRKYTSSNTLTCIVHIIEPKLCQLLREKEIGSEKTYNFRLEFFDIFDSGARDWLTEFSPFTKCSTNEFQPHLLIVGMGKMGDSIILQSAKRWKDLSLTLNKKLRITVIDKEAEVKIESLQLRYQRLTEICELIPLEMDIESPEFRRAKFLHDNDQNGDITYISICLNNDSCGLASALVLQSQIKDQNIPIVIRMETDGGLASLLGEKSGKEEFNQLKAFGLLDRTCELELLLGGVNETLARAAHQEYIQTQLDTGETVATNPHIVAWEQLNDEIKESNRLQADHIISKLKAIDCTIAPLIDWDAAHFSFTSEEIELMAEMEHVRWMSERLAAGWTYKPGKKNIKKKTSPYLTDWSALPEEIKKIDRDIVIRIPKFLAKVDLQIYRQQ